jgi:hypothetical protein
MAVRSIAALLGAGARMSDSDRSAGGPKRDVPSATPANAGYRREQFDRFAANGFDLPLNWNWSEGMFLLAEVCAALRDARAAELLYARLRPVAEQVGFVGGNRCVGSLGYPAGVLAACLQRWEEATRHFEHAVAMNDRLGARPAAVRTRRAYAAMLLDRNASGDQARAAALITAALAETEHLDMPAEAAKLQRLRARLF